MEGSLSDSSPLFSGGTSSWCGRGVSTSCFGLGSSPYSISTGWGYYLLNVKVRSFFTVKSKPSSLY